MAVNDSDSAKGVHHVCHLPARQHLFDLHGCPDGLGAAVGAVAGGGGCSGDMYAVYERLDFKHHQYQNAGVIRQFFTTIYGHIKKHRRPIYRARCDLCRLDALHLWVDW